MKGGVSKWGKINRGKKWTVRREGEKESEENRKEKGGEGGVRKYSHEYFSFFSYRLYFLVRTLSYPYIRVSINRIIVGTNSE